MSIPVPGTLFVQYHAGWKFTAAHVEGADLRFCIESPAKRIFLSFRIEKDNEPKLYDCLRLTHGNKEKSRPAEKEQLETNGKREGGSAA